MKTTKLILSLQAALFVAAATTASAHIGYTGRDFGSYTGSDVTKTITNQYVTSDYGWADATDANLGDTHKTRAFKFNLTTDAWVTLSFQGLAYTSGATSYTALALPAFSLYRGVAAAATHDGSAISIAWRDATYGTNATEGSLNALGDWKIGSDTNTTFAELSSFTYIGNAASGTTANYGIPAASSRLRTATSSPMPRSTETGTPMAPCQAPSTWERAITRSSLEVQTTTEPLPTPPTGSKAPLRLCLNPPRGRC